MPAPTGPDHRAAVSALWLVCLSPVAFLPGGFDRFTFPTVLACGAALLIGATLRAPGRLPRLVGALTTAFLVGFALAALLSDTPVAALLGRWPRYEGLPMVLLYAGMLWLGAAVLGGRHRAERATDLVAATSVASIALALIAVAERLGWSLVGASDVSRPGATLGNATDQGLVAAMSAVLLLPQALGPRAWLARVGTTAAAATVALSQSRSALVALAVGVVVAALASRGLRRRVLLVGIGVAGAGLAVLAAGRLTSTDTLSGRLLLWRESATLAADHLMHGIGPSRFGDLLPARHGATWVTTVGTDNPPDSPHNVVLQVLLVGGVPLLAIAIALGVAIVKRGAAVAIAAPAGDLAPGLLGAACGYGVAMAANVTGVGTTGLVLFLTGALVGTSCGGEVGRAARDRVARGAVAAAALATVCWSLGAMLADLALADGVEAASADRVGAADQQFVQARRLRPLDADVCRIAAQSLALPASAGDRRAAAAAARWSDCAVAALPDSRDARVAGAVAAIAQGEPEAALALLEPLRTLDPTAPDVWVQRAIAQAVLGDLPAARESIRTALQIAPDDPGANTVAERLGSVR